ncbi:MAG: hypothetical protein IIA98_02940 [Proteobacteria bacterium]|nr:hypothetical protein [Pseudomonadota bacterium]
MKRTKFSRGSDKEESLAVAKFLAAMDGPRQLIRPTLETLAKQYGLSYLEIMLCLLVECQDGAAHAQERELVRLLGPPLVFTFRRATGESAETAKRELLRELGIVPAQNAPSSSSVQ